ncbi:FAD-dependent oxidoreductase [Actinophytocola gossypii]|uniref:FAD-dependent oxidoreductase n=1 Tax=Actinophytocola gossypii TaxID=2812003 RepID=A0ABT2J8Z0_9PSEU|nr:FAD-dependent oxidoreductase [Actinophytocola gossypii]MCT2584331.1 FAD-dependent oxidoreductase [Actinophytocola gossypii]
MAELVVYGATAAGVCAAVAAARHGVPVTLLEPGRHVGGMVSGGLGYTDIGDPRVLGGMAGEFAAAVAEHYGTSRYAGPEPHVAERIFESWLDRAGVAVVFGVGVSAVEGSISVLHGTDGRSYRAGVYVDASYEGDLLAAAGVPYRVGRESRSLHGETFAGRREWAPGKHNFEPYLSPFAADGSLLPLIDSSPTVDAGEGDGAVMAYGYRVCLSTADDRLPFTRRDGYREEEWELARRYFAMLAERDLEPPDVLGLVRNLPNGKCDGNSIGPLSVNLLDGANRAYPDAGPAERAAIVRRYQEYTVDFLHFMSTDPAVPRQVRDRLGEWGWAADEFDGGLPHQLYVREARRMLGEYTLTEHDLHTAPTPKYDTIAMGSYHIDIREVRRTWRWVYEHPDPIPSVYNEGYLSVPVRPYQVPYRAIVPRYADCTNLLVPVCLSASHVAFSSVRMEPQYEMLGHAAGLAAWRALTTDRPVQQVDVADLQQHLLDERQILTI